MTHTDDKPVLLTAAMAEWMAGAIRDCTGSASGPATAALRAIASGQVVCVPAEPTLVMLNACADHWPHGGRISGAMIRAYKAMLAAAPAHNEEKKP